MAPKKKKLASKHCQICDNVFHQKRYSSGPDANFKKRKYCGQKCAGKAIMVKEYVKTRRRKEVIAAYGGECLCCGEKDWHFLSLDHINNDGAKHRREVGASGVYKWAIDNKFPPTLRILCFNCNMARAFYKNCPHEIS